MRILYLSFLYIPSIVGLISLFIYLITNLGSEFYSLKEDRDIISISSRLVRLIRLGLVRLVILIIILVLDK